MVYFGNAKLPQVQPWITQLKAGVVDRNNDNNLLDVCLYDLENIEYLTNTLLNSIETSFKTDVLHSVGRGADGLTVFCIILQKCVKSNLSLQHQLVKSWRMCPSSKKKAKALKSSTRNFVSLSSALVVQATIQLTYPILSSSVSKAHLLTYLDLDRVHNAHHEDIFLPELESFYESFLWRLGTLCLKKVSHTDFAKYQQSTNQKMNVFTLKNDESGKGASSSTNITKTTRCFDCCKPNVKLEHYGCTQKEKKLYMPKSSPSALKPPSYTTRATYQCS